MDACFLALTMRRNLYKLYFRINTRERHILYPQKLTPLRIFWIVHFERVNPRELCKNSTIAFLNIRHFARKNPTDRKSSTYRT